MFLNDSIILLFAGLHCIERPKFSQLSIDNWTSKRLSLVALHYFGVYLMIGAYLKYTFLL